MRVDADALGRWTVELVDGSVVNVWAAGFSREGEHYTFSVLVDLDDGEELTFDALVMGDTPANPSRFVVAVARFPKAAVRLRDGDEEEPEIYSG
jgi:hypothetical protein